MSYKLIGKLRASSPPHLYLDQIKKLISQDDYLLPQMRNLLLVMKKTKYAFIRLPHQREVIISPEFNCNLDRHLSPELTAFIKTSWSEKDLENYKKDKSKFIHDVKNFYDELGYDIEQSTISEDLVKALVDDIDKKLEKTKSRLLDKIK